MSEQLDDFLVGLATNPQRLAEFQTNPAAAMKTLHLSRGERRALLARDGETLRQAIKKSEGPTQVNNAVTQTKKGAAQGKPTKKKSSKK
jgi:hypothetical protein